MEVHKGIKAIEAKNRKVWRAWLKKNHATESSAWLIIHHKSSEIPSVYYNDAVEEALCFGWIDSKPNKRNDTSYYLFFARRKPKSNWSKLNKERVEQLTKQGLMTPAGQAMIDLAKKTGTWLALVEVDNITIPSDLSEAFEKNKTAWRHFSGFSPSAQRGILQWILNAKRPETRQQRIAVTVTKATQKIIANAYTPKK